MNKIFLYLYIKFIQKSFRANIDQVLRNLKTVEAAEEYLRTEIKFGNGIRVTGSLGFIFGLFQANYSVMGTALTLVFIVIGFSILLFTGSLFVYESIHFLDILLDKNNQLPTPPQE